MKPIERTLQAAADPMAIRIDPMPGDESRITVRIGGADPEIVSLPPEGATAWDLTWRGRRLRVVAIRAGRGVEVSVDGQRFLVHPVAGRASQGKTASSGAILAPMPGRVVEIGVEVGQTVRRGEKVLVLEAMKMRTTLSAPHDGRVEALRCAVNEQVTGGQELARISDSGAKHG